MWMNEKGLSYDGVHMQVPSLYHKWNSTGSLSLLADLPWLSQNTDCIHHPLPLFHLSINAIFLLLLLLPALQCLLFLPFKSSLKEHGASQDL